MAELGEGFTPDDEGAETTGGSSVETGYVNPSGEGETGYDSGSVDYAALITSIFDGINDAVNLWYNISRQQADPCQAWINLGNWDTNIYRPNYRRAMTKARQLTVALQDHMENLIRTRGRSGGTGIPLERFIFEEMGGLGGAAQELLLPERQLGWIRPVCVAQILAGTPQLCVAHITDAIRSHLPLADDIRNGTISPMETESLSPGIGLTENRYTGTRIIEIVERWLDHQYREANPPEHPNARNKLINLVGTWEGTGPFGFWKAPDNPEALFIRVPLESGTFEAANQMVIGTELDLPPEGGPCAGVGSLSSTIVWLPDGGNGDPILPASKVYEITRFIIWTRNFRACMGAICFGMGPPSPLDLLPDKVTIDISNGASSTGTGDVDLDQEEGINWLIVGAVAAAAWVLM